MSKKDSAASSKVILLSMIVAALALFAGYSNGQPQGASSRTFQFTMGSLLA